MNFESGIVQDPANRRTSETVSSYLSAIAIFVRYQFHLEPRAFLNLSVVVLIVPSAIATLATARYIRNRSHQSLEP